jgi:hypothetical protein
MISNEIIMVGIAAPVLGLMVIFIFLNAVDPLQHPEVEALKFAKKISSYANSLSTVERGFVTVGLDQKYDVELKYFENGYKSDDMGFFRTFFIQGIELDAEGYYILVTPYKNETEKMKTAPSFVITYPKEEGLDKKFEKVEEICLEKKEMVEVREC